MYNKPCQTRSVAINWSRFYWWQNGNLVYKQYTHTNVNRRIKNALKQLIDRNDEFLLCCLFTICFRV